MVGGLVEILVWERIRLGLVNEVVPDIEAEYVVRTLHEHF